MSYSIKSVTKGYVNKEGLTKVFIQVIYNRMLVYVPTIIQIPESSFENGEIVKHVSAKKYNTFLAREKNEIETRLLDALQKNKNLSKHQLSEIAKGKFASNNTIKDYIDTLKGELHGKLSRGRLEHYSGIAVKVEAFEPGAKLSGISVRWLQRFEAWLRKQPGRDGEPMDGNTVQSKMTLMKAVCGYAKDAGLIEETQYKAYKVPKYVQKLPDYLTEAEMAKLFDFLQVIDRPGHKLAGYYFLLSCYAGYRIGTLKEFDYKERIKGDRIMLRTKKNQNIVSIIIHSRLQKILDYIKDKPLTLSEPKVREYVKELAVNIGLGRRIKVHTARHSFGMLLAENGFSLDEAAELLGDSTLVTKTYFRMSNKRLDDKVRERLG